MKKSIGTRKESSLHRTLKFQYAGPGGKTEAEIGGYVADGITKEGEYIEVQTGSFAPLKKKVKEFTINGKVRIIHPVAVKKTIEVYGKNGKLLYKRKSPLKGTSWNIFNALLHAPELPLVKGVTIEIAMVEITEKRIKDGKGAWRRRGISIGDKSLTSWCESIIFKKPADYLRFIPFKKREEFTGADLAYNAKIDKQMAQKVLYVLTRLKVVKRIGKKSRSYLYVRK